MPKYILAVKSSRDDYEEINWTNNEDDLYLLEKIDTFTNEFNNIDELRDYLRARGLIAYIYRNKPIVIKYRYQNQNKVVSNGVMTNVDRRWLNPEYLINYVQINKDDLLFLKNFCNHYRNSYDMVDLSAISNYAFSQDEKFETNMAIKNFIWREISAFNRKTNKYEINYKKLRGLGLFLAEQDRRKIIEMNKGQEKGPVLSKRKELDGQISFDDLN